MIDLNQYFGIYANHSDASPGMWAAADAMLEKVNRLIDRAESEGVEVEVNPITKSQVGGETLGGFRPQDCPVGAPASSHKKARAVDVYDPHNALDDWVTDSILAEFGLYREAPDTTNHWCHLTDKAPGSGKRTFNP